MPGFCRYFSLGLRLQNLVWSPATLTPWARVCQVFKSDPRDSFRGEGEFLFEQTKNSQSDSVRFFQSLKDFLSLFRGCCRWTSERTLLIKECVACLRECYCKFNLFQVGDSYSLKVFSSKRRFWGCSCTFETVFRRFTWTISAPPFSTKWLQPCSYHSYHNETTTRKLPPIPSTRKTLKIFKFCHCARCTRKNGFLRVELTAF